MRDEIVVVGLPSAGLRKLVSAFDIQHLEDVAITKAYSTLSDAGDLTPAWMARNLVKHFHEGRSCHRLIVYQLPWGFLKRQIRQAPSLPKERGKLENLAKRVLQFWHAYHAPLTRLHREHESRSLLINGDRPVETGAVIAIVEQRFGLQLRVQQNYPETEEHDVGSNHDAAWRQIVKALAPECHDLCIELESCAQLIGRQPELTLREFACQEDYTVDMLWLMANQGRIDDVLKQRGIDAGDLASRLEIAFQAHRELKELATTRLREIVTLEEREATQHVEADRLLNQIRDSEEKMRSQQVEIDGYLTQLHQLKEKLKSMQAADNNHLLHLREKEEKLVAQHSQTESLKKENELCLFQLHHIQEELGQYFKLNRQKDRQISDLQHTLNHHVGIGQEKDKQLAELRKQLERGATSIVRKFTRRIANLKKSPIQDTPR